MIAPNTKGILTMAYGKPRYIRQAIHFARSLIVTNPATPRAIITDQPDHPGLRRYFQHVIPMRPEFGVGMKQKVFVYEYSPFTETLCIDADCLAVRPLDGLWSALSARPYGVFGHMIRENNMWFHYIDRYREVSGKPEVPGISGGIHYFNRSPEAESIAKRAMELALNFEPMLQKLGMPLDAHDETCFCFSLSEHDVTPVDDRVAHRQIGPVQFQWGRVWCDIPRHQFRCETAEGMAESYIMHFYWDWDKGFHYQRETTKLKLIVDYHLPRRLASFLVNATWNPGWFVFTEAYRRLRMAKDPALRIPRFTCWPYSHFGGGWRSRLTTT